MFDIRQVVGDHHGYHRLDKTMSDIGVCSKLCHTQKG